MTPLTFRAMGTEWWIGVDDPGLLHGVSSLVAALEATLSRFLPDSALSRLNRDRTATDPVLADVVELALSWRSRTRGAFDPTLGLALCRAGYDRDFSRIGTPAAEAGDHRPQVVVAGDRVTLEGEGLLDLGGLGKGYAVDRVGALLRARGARAFLVDGGGDLLAHGSPVAVGVPGDRAVLLSDTAVATSSVLERSWRTSDGRLRHHILDPATGASTRGEFLTVTVQAPDAVTADILATALIVRPAEVLSLLPRWEASALVLDREERAWATSSWKEAS